MSSKSPKNPAKKTPKKTSEGGSASAAASPATKAASKVATKVVAPAEASLDIGDHHLVKMKQVYLASRALKTHIAKLGQVKGGKAQLFTSNSPVNVEILLHRHPIKGNMKRKLLPLVKPMNAGAEICLFAKDSKLAKVKVQQYGVKNIKKVIDLKKLRSHYNQYEARRTLAASYDLFIVEDTILPDVCNQLGKSFLSTRRAPVAFKLNTTAAEQVDRIRNSALFNFSHGVTQSYKIGDTSYTEEELCKNFASSIDAAVQLFPLGWSNVKQIAIISTGSSPLPVYNNLTAPPKEERKDKKEKKETKAAEPVPAKGKRAAPAPVAADVEEVDTTPAKKKKAVASENGKATPTKVEAAAKPKAASTPKAAAKKESATESPAAKAKPATPKATEKTETAAAGKKTSASPKAAAASKKTETPTKKSQVEEAPASDSKKKAAKSTPSKSTVTPTKSATPAKSPKSSTKKK